MNCYNVEKVIDNLNNRGYTNFINQVLLKDVKGRLHKNEYKLYSLYPESNKVILYKKNIPEISLFKIECSVELRHQDIMGTIYSMGTSDDMFGDIIKINNEYYIFLLPILEDYFKYNLNKIRNNNIELIKVDLNTKELFHQEYEIIEKHVSSLRIDNVLSSLINTSRNEILTKFKDKEIELNYEEPKNTKELKIGDIFSIRKYGKYKYNGIKKETKKGYIIEILKYK